VGGRVGGGAAVKFISVFAGIGGFDLGLERAGMTCVAQVEIDEFCQRVLTKHWPEVPKYGDIREVGKHNLPSADLICGGFPCQPHSFAGKRRGAEDDRHLWPEYLRIIDELRPSWVVPENVFGIVTTILDQVLSDLEGLNYTAVPLVIPACAFNAPHRRDRVFPVAYSDEYSKSAESVNERRKISRTMVPNSVRKGLERENGTGLQASLIARRDWRITQPVIRGRDDGVSRGMDQHRRRTLGNAVVPQVAEFIGRAIMESNAATVNNR